MDTKGRILSGLRLGTILIGIIGNILIFVIYSRPVFKNNSISIYSRALALVESGTIINLIYEYGTTFFNYFIGNHSDLGCILFYYIGISTASSSGWILVALSIDKLLSIRKPGKSSFFKQRSFHYMVVLSIVLINLLLFIEIPIYLRLELRFNATNRTGIIWICDSASLPFARFVNSASLIEGNIVPFLIMFLTSIISIRLIRKSSQNVSKYLTRRNSRQRSDMKFAITSISFNFMFILLRLPFIVVAVLMSFSHGVSIFSLEVELTYLVYFMSYSSGIVVHFLSNNLFRREFYQAFTFQNQQS